ncbi:MAG: hypothetical protein OEL54_05925 [Flavobacteriaceae bacterium]|nr:hypothetical protein [Flavobacteriaceae bacterium]
MICIVNFSMELWNKYKQAIITSIVMLLITGTTTIATGLWNWANAPIENKRQIDKCYTELAQIKQISINYCTKDESRRVDSTLLEAILEIDKSVKDGLSAIQSKIQSLSDETKSLRDETKTLNGSMEVLIITRRNAYKNIDTIDKSYVFN